MCRTIKRRVLMTCCAAAILLGAPCRSWAKCALSDWMFGHGQTTYAPPYSRPDVYVPAAGACGLRTRPMRTRPLRTRSMRTGPTGLPALRAHGYLPHFLPAGGHGGLHAGGRHRSLQRLRGDDLSSHADMDLPGLAGAVFAVPVGYAPVAVGVAPCGSCGGCAPCSGYSASCGGFAACGTSYSGCSSCGCGTSYGGCSSCNAGVSSSYVPSSGCSSCAFMPAPLSGTPLPGPSDMSQPPTSLSPPEHSRGARFFVRTGRLRSRLHQGAESRRCARQPFVFRHVVSRLNPQRGNSHRRAAPNRGRSSHPRPATGPHAQSAAGKRESQQPRDRCCKRPTFRSCNRLRPRSRHN